MRHPERRIGNKETMVAMLKQSPVGRIATINRKGIPVIKPVNFLYLDGRVYFHSSPKGEKISDIRRGSPICFEVDEPIAYVAASGVACESDYYYRSIIIKGEAVLVADRRRKLRILEKMMEKYQPEGGYGRIPEKILRKTVLVEISVDQVTGKEKLK